MIELRTFADIESKLAEYIPLVKEITGKGMTLERMHPLMRAVGNPEQKLKVIHIAGTSGKTSTTYYIAALLEATGKKVGLTVSPHVDSVAERIQINVEPISEQAFAQSLSEFIGIVDAAHLQPTYFELLVAFAYWYFLREGVDYAVVETGMGGLGDGTNVAERADKVCVITDIGFDHMHVLGSTLPEIATQKAGIIHDKNHTIMFHQAEEIMNVFKQWCEAHDAPLDIFEPDLTTLNLHDELVLKSLPEFQQRNWSLAYRTFLYIKERDNLKLLSEDLLNETMATRVPGRMDTIQLSGKTIIMDGAHNEQKMAAFVGSFKEKYPSEKASIMLSLKQDKQFGEVLPLLLSVTDALIITSFQASQDLPSVGLQPEILASEAKRLGFRNIIVEPDCNEAYELLLKQPSPVGIITGSFYLIGQLRHAHPELRNA
jgi:dihydrofolate synthase / folylpolyglutamate synthase